MIMENDKEKQIVEMLEDINEKLKVISAKMKNSPERSEIIKHREDLEIIQANLKKVTASRDDNLLLFKKD